METRNEQMQTPTPTPTRSPKNDLSLDKTTLEELTTPVSPTTATTSKTKIKRGFTSNKTKILLGSIVGMCRRRGQICTHIKTKFINEMIKEEMPRLVNLAINKDREITTTNVPDLIYKEFATHGPKIIEELFQKHMQNTTLILYLTTSSSTADLQHQLYFNMKSKPQDQAVDPELWEILKANFEKP
ncbi:hypothetical protein Tco_1225241 [Tanacetum coccineum]